jgi:hypothetical protein
MKYEDSEDERSLSLSFIYISLYIYYLELMNYTSRNIPGKLK